MRDVMDIAEILPLEAVKYLLMAINFIIWVVSAGLVAVAIWIRSDGHLWEFVQCLDLYHYYQASYIIMAVGIVLLIFSFVGCLGSATDSPVMLSSYVVITVICIVLEVTACILVWKTAGGDDLQNVLSKEIKIHVDNRIYNDTSRRFLDLLQMKLECCGAETYVDYKKLDQDIPASCNSDRTNNVHIRSCGEMLRRMLEIRGAWIGGLSIGLILLQLLIILFNSLLLGLMKYKDEKLLKSYR